MIRRRAAARPPTSCAACLHAELGPLEQFMCVVSVLWSGTCPHQRGVAGLGGVLAATLRAGLGQPVPTWYEQHRQLWVRDGEPAELARMLRHVGGPDDV